MKDTPPTTPAGAAGLLPASLAGELLEESLLVVPAMNLREVGARLLSPLLRSTGAKRASLMIVNPQTGRLCIVAGVGIRADLIGRDSEWRPNSISEWVYRKRTGLVLNGQVRSDSLTGSAEESIESAMCLPLETDGGVLGVLNLARTAPAPVFDETEMAQLRAILPPVAAALERATHAIRSERVATQLRSASGLVAHTLLQPGRHEARHFEFGYARRSSTLEGGDACERVPFANGGQALVALDASGEGVDAVLTVAHALGLFVGGASPERDPATTTARINTELFQRLAGRAAVAMWAAKLSPNGQLSSCTAGYPAPLWVPADDSPVVRLVSGGPPAGSAATVDWQEEQVRLLAGDIVVAASDGVFDAQNVTGQPFGDERLIETVCEFRRHPLDALADEVLARVRSWTGREVPTDDLSVLAVRFRPEN